MTYHGNYYDKFLRNGDQSDRYDESEAPKDNSYYNRYLINNRRERLKNHSKDQDYRRY